MSRLRERALDRAEQEVVHRARVAKAHFELLRMRVDVDLQRIERQVQDPGRVAVAIADVAVAEAHGAPEQAVPHHAAVHVQVLPVGLRARCRRQPDPALERKARLRELDVARGRDEVRADELRDARLALAPPRRRRQRELLAAVVRQRERDVEARQREPRHGPQDVLVFGRLGAQELAARRHAMKEVAHLDRRAGRVRGGHRARHAAVDRLDHDRIRAAARARSDAQARHRRDRRQRLAAKAQARYALEVL